ncbi:ORF6N domain-containing protein [Paenisporosarcina sp. TG-14]|uniref:ORF6N domain-containing protein n=1 Tax=Paenisporosarcina sp. TG-14 TaxID=1231057 RepID=UPI0002D9C0F8|nr:ORF6N domain-containing protein [Paenisporosarcina sp. TG-14]
MNLSIIEQNNQRVLTTSQLAESYGAEKQLVINNFNRNKERYTEGKHFIALQGDVKREFFCENQIDFSKKDHSIFYLWTEKGAWLHAKSLNTDEAWDAYEMLVDEYYAIQKQVKALTEREQLEASMKLSLMTSEDVKELKGEVVQIRGMVENQITLDYGEQRRLQKAVAIKVYEQSSSVDHQRQLFSELYREIKDRFAVASYKDVKRKEFQKAIRYIESWIPRKVS